MSLAGVFMESAMQYENKTNNYKFKRKKKILKVFMEKQIFYKETRTKQLFLRSYEQISVLEGKDLRVGIQWGK